MPSPPQRVSVIAAVLVLALAGCSDGKEPASDPAASATGAPLRKVSPAEVKALVGRWTGPSQDYFQFKSDGSAIWVAKGKTLWTGQVIPDGKDQFRFSWQGSDPQNASYWGVTLSSGGTKLVFGGTNQTYSKAAATPTGKATKKTQTGTATTKARN